MQLANTPPLQSTTPGLHPVIFHQMAPPVRGNTHPITAYYTVYRPRKDERLSRPSWLVTYRNKVPPPEVEPGHVTHPSTNRAARSVTLLIRSTPLPLGLRHAAASGEICGCCIFDSELVEDKNFGKKKLASADVIKPSSQADQQKTEKEVEDSSEGRLLLLRLS